MEKLKKGDLLYEAFLNSINKEMRNELLTNDKRLSEAKKNYDKLVERIKTEYRHEFLSTGESNLFEEMDAYDGLYYLLYQFTAWLNSAL